MARILVTRPREDAAPFAEALARLGHEVLLEPLLEVRLRDVPAPDLTGVQALLFTSANGVRALARLTASRDLKALCVGDATGRAAREAGFTEVESAAGDVISLAALVRDRLRPDGGPLLHAAATVSAGDLAGDLGASGYEVRRAVLYEAVPAARLSDAAARALAQGRIDAVSLFSPRTARTFARIVAQTALASSCAMVDMLCLSQAVADALGATPRRKLLVAAEPTQNALIDLIR